MFDPAGVSDAALVDAIAAWDRVVSWAQAAQLAAIAELARRRPAQPGQPSDGTGVSEFAVDEVAAALRLSRPAAGARLQVAVEVATRLPATGAALRRGEIDFARARAVVEAVTPLADPAAAAVEARVLPRAGSQTVGQLRASLARAVPAADPAAAEVRHARAVADRRVALTPLADGVAELWALLPADAATAVYTAIDTHARSGPADHRTMDARRADALTHLITAAHTDTTTAAHTTTVAGAATPSRTRTRTATGGVASAGTVAGAVASSGALAGTATTGTGKLTGARTTTDTAASTAAPTGAATSTHTATAPGTVTRGRRPGSGPLVHVTVAASTLLGLDDEPADLTGYGPIPASMARRIAADPTGTWRRILTDPASGTVLDVGRTTYRPPPAIARHVTTRDQTCRFPTCRQPAHRCDLDHIRPYPTGPTAVNNLTTLCRHHHRLKHHGTWKVTPIGNGNLTWTAPTGHRYTTQPAGGSGRSS
jgi:hypothetical protein